MSEIEDMFGGRGTIAATAKPKQRGYADMPGTGPDGETCRTCVHCVVQSGFSKCYLMAFRWTKGFATDILQRSPACKRWEAPAPDGGRALGSAEGRID